MKNIIMTIAAIAFVLIVITMMDIPLWNECVSRGFSHYYCFMHLK